MMPLIKPRMIPSHPSELAMESMRSSTSPRMPSTSPRRTSTKSKMLLTVSVMIVHRSRNDLSAAIGSVKMHTTNVTSQETTCRTNVMTMPITMVTTWQTIVTTHLPTVTTTHTTIFTRTVTASHNQFSGHGQLRQRSSCCEIH